MMLWPDCVPKVDHCPPFLSLFFFLFVCFRKSSEISLKAEFVLPHVYGFLHSSWGLSCEVQIAQALEEHFTSWCVTEGVGGRRVDGCLIPTIEVTGFFEG